MAANRWAQAKLVAATLACLLALAGCSGEPKVTGSPIVAPQVKFEMAGWGEPNYKNGYSEQDIERNLLLKMKLKV